MASLIYFIKHPNQALMGIVTKYCGWIKSDEFIVKCLYRLAKGKRLNLDNPQSFVEKMQWLKLYNRDPLYTTLVDKHLVKDYVAKTIGDDYIIPTLGVYSHAEDIDWDSLPNQFVLKTNHDSGSVVVCKDKSTFDKDNAIKKLNKALRHNSYKTYREWAYKDVKRCIIAEQYLEDESRSELKDYKIFCFNGVPKFIELDYSRFISGIKRIVYTTDWQRMDVEYNKPTEKDKGFPRPESLEKMVEAARTLSKNFPFVRADFYDVNGHLYFGELTFYPAGGFIWFKPESFDLEIGSWLKLPAKK